MTIGGLIEMRVFRAIYRLDFLRNYEMMNQPGTVARLVEALGAGGFFDAYGEERAARRLLAKCLVKAEARSRAVSVEPTAIVCDLERSDGIAIDALTEDGDFARLCTLATNLLTEFRISRLERAGLRLFLFGSNGENRKAVVRACRSLLVSSLRDEAESALGVAADVGVAMDGISDTNISYHFKIGPFVGSEEIGKYFSSINELLGDSFKPDTVIDLDLFENKFTLTALKAINWSRPQVTLAAKLASKMAQLIAVQAKT
jgi:hypothetical protein